MKKLRLALCQINPTVGDIQGNAAKIIRWMEKASAYQPDIIIFPELAITGYPPEDLLLKPRFIKDNMEGLSEILPAVGDFLAIVGFVDKKDHLHNAAALMHKGSILDIYHKIHLPNYGVFDELRYFRAGTRRPVYRSGDISFSINICEDIWHPEGPAAIQSLAGAELIININASPYHIGKAKLRDKMLSARAVDNVAAIAYLNTVGGQDELVFDGNSLIINQDGEAIARAKGFEDDLIIADIDLGPVSIKRLQDPARRQSAAGLSKDRYEEIKINSPSPHPSPASGEENSPLSTKGEVNSPLIKGDKGGCSYTLTQEEEIFKALVLGTRDYVLKNGFSKVCVGLSGGIDSALVAAIAVQSLGKENVTGVFMPSQYTSVLSGTDTASLATNLGIKTIEIPITGIFTSYLSELAPHFENRSPDTTEENLQARIRGNMLMALSNKFGMLVLTTGNKSEMSVGYATLYGDMAGGFAVIKDLPKTLVYKVSAWFNKKSGKDMIPKSIITKEPTAELRPDQRDTDSLPPYEELDPILKAYVEDDKGFDEIAGVICSEETARKVIRMVDINEYKRRQAPPGIKITERAFGRDRRVPITNGYRQS
ncbi:MAG: NAD+ synthase [Nitrospirae bacterium]|nr:MAG: NAD+ synthase [Nitrospirota bacterium]